MAIKVLVVDDSGFFRRRLTEILGSNPQIEVVGTANNGQEAIDKTLALKPDVITMDYEMPLMNGITAVREIMRRCPTPVLMFSSLTHEAPGSPWMRWTPAQWITCRRISRTSRATSRRSRRCSARRC